MADSTVKATGVVRRLREDLSLNTEAGLSLTMQGAVRTQAALPWRTELARAGRRFCVSAGVVANAQVPVADFPTTTAKYALYNGSAQDGTGRAYIIESVSYTAASGTLGLGSALLCGVTGTVQSSAVANGTGVVFGKLSGQTGSSDATFGNGITLAAAPAWIPVAAMNQPAAVSVGSGQVAWVDGLFIVRPGMCLGMVVLAPTGTTAKFGCHVVWSEVDVAALDLQN